MHLVVCIKEVPVTAQTRVHLARTRSCGGRCCGPPPFRVIHSFTLHRRLEAVADRKLNTPEGYGEATGHMRTHPSRLSGHGGNMPPLAG